MHQGETDGDDGSHQRAERGESHRPPHQPHPAHHIAGNAGAFGLFLEMRTWDKAHADTGEHLVQRLHNHLHLSSCRVIDHRLAPEKAVQHHIVVESPVDDGGKLCLVAQVGEVAGDTGGLEAVRTCGLHQGQGAGTVTADPAVQPHLAERDVLLVIGADHGQTGSPALCRLHLHDLGNPCHRHRSSPLDHVFDRPLVAEGDGDIAQRLLRHTGRFVHLDHQTAHELAGHQVGLQPVAGNPLVQLTLRVGMLVDGDHLPGSNVPAQVRDADERILQPGGV